MDCCNYKKKLEEPQPYQEYNLKMSSLEYIKEFSNIDIISINDNLFFIFGRIMGLNLARIFFSYLFEKIGPIFKSKKIILDNLQKISNFKKVDNDNSIEYDGKAIQNNYISITPISFDLTDESYLNDLKKINE